ncbi:MAG: hypothetical protein ACLRJV_20570 [Eubacteriales bacterium]
MNWTRTILDGLAMAAYFNLFAGLVALYHPRLVFPSYPPAIIKVAKEPPTGAENQFYWLWICFGELLPLLLYGAISTGGWDDRILAAGPDRVYPVDDGQFL